MLETLNMVDSKKMVKQVIDFQKTAFEGAFTAVSFIQDQASNGVQQAIDAAVWMPAENRKQADALLAACAQSREQFKEFVGDNFDRIESIFAETKKTGKAAATKAK